MIESIFLKGDTLSTKDNLNIKVISAMTCSAIYSGAYSWFKDGKNNKPDLLVEIVRPYVMNGLDMYRSYD